MARKPGDIAACSACGRKSPALVIHVASGSYIERNGGMVRRQSRNEVSAEEARTWWRARCLDRKACHDYLRERDRLEKERRTRRTAKPHFPKAPVGSCKWCGEEIAMKDGKKSRRSWHRGDDREVGDRNCLDEYLPQTGSGGARMALFGRDHGVCAECGTDTQAVEREWNARRPKMPDYELDNWHEAQDGYYEAHREWIRSQPRASMWCADHRVPIVDGGANTLDNLQTLCDPCHGRKTAREARERAQRRRGQPSLLDDETTVR